MGCYALESRRYIAFLNSFLFGFIVLHSCEAYLMTQAVDSRCQSQRVAPPFGLATPKGTMWLYTRPKCTFNPIFSYFYFCVFGVGHNLPHGRFVSISVQGLSDSCFLDTMYTEVLKFDVWGVKWLSQRIRFWSSMG